MSFLQQEIRQQPQVLMTLLDQEWENVQRIARTSTQNEIDILIRDAGLPLRNGIGGKYSVAA